MKINEMRGNQFLPGNCIYRPENYPEDWRERLEAGEAVTIPGMIEYQQRRQPAVDLADQNQPPTDNRP